jgi:hypothetical protein
MQYDQLFKRLLKTFFRFFIELFFPEVFAQIRWDAIEFLDKEEQAQDTESQSFSRLSDVMVKVTTVDGEMEFIIHVEVENPWRSSFPSRMFEYFALFWLRHTLPIFPIAVLPERRIKPFEFESYGQSLFGHEILTYNYFHIGLPGLSVDDYWRDDNPVSWAFSAFMERGNRDKIQLMGECFRRVYQSPFTDAEKTLLLDFIRTYYQLTTDEAEAFEALLRQQTYQEVREMELSYYGKMAQQEAQEEVKQVLLEQLTTKFGELASDTVSCVRAIQSRDELRLLAKKVLTANSLTELGLNGADSLEQR